MKKNINEKKKKRNRVIINEMKIKKKKWNIENNEWKK